MDYNLVDKKYIYRKTPVNGLGNRHNPIGNNVKR